MEHANHLNRAAALACGILLAIACLVAPATARAATVSVTVSSIDELVDALDDAEAATTSSPYVITLKKGSYTLSTTLYLPSNTTLVATGCTIKQASAASGVMLRTGNDAESCGSASGYCFVNITVTGGTWDMNGHASTLFQICHAKNVTVQDATFQNVENGHLMEVAGVSGLTVYNCDFLDQELTSSADATTYEAIQIDILQNKSSDGSGTGHLIGYAPEDLANKSISITYCDFDNVPRGVGSHTAVLNNPINGLTISHCTFNDVGSAAIQLMAVKNATITYNTITDAARGIFIYSYRTTGTFKGSYIDSSSTTSTAAKALAAATTISNNTITLNSSDDAYDDWQKCAILVEGLSLSSATEGATSGGYTGNKLSKGNYYISGVTITNNTIKTALHGIRLNDARGCTVSGNTITYTGTNSAESYGIAVGQASKGVDSAITIQSNVIKNNSSSKKIYRGIFVFDSSSVKTISSNTIPATRGDGIFIYDGSTVKTISKNTITSAGRNGIYLYDGSSSTTISSNTVKSATKYGIGVDGSTATTIKSNTITSAKSYGIMVYNKAKVTTIKSNTISKGSSDAIHIYVLKTTSSYKVTVSSNTITGKSKGTYGIWASQSYVASSSNTIKSCSYPIYYTSTAKGSIGYNTLSSNKYNKYKIGGKTSGNLAKVTGVSISAKAKTSLTVKWTKNSSATGYQVYRATSKSGTYSAVKTVSSYKTVTFKNTGLTKSKTYYYKVRAYKTVGSIKIYGPYSSIVSGKTKSS